MSDLFYQRGNREPEVKSPVQGPRASQYGPQAALGVIGLLIPFSSRDPRRLAVKQTFMEALSGSGAELGAGVQT